MDGTRCLVLYTIANLMLLILPILSFGDNISTISAKLFTNVGLDESQWWRWLISLNFSAYFFVTTQPALTPTRLPERERG